MGYMCVEYMNVPLWGGSTNKDNSGGYFSSIHKYPKGISIWLQISVMNLCAQTQIHGLHKQLLAVPKTPAL